MQSSLTRTLTQVESYQWKLKATYQFPKMSVDWRLSFLLIQKFQKWDRNVRENLKVLSNSHSQTAAASVSCELSFIRHLGVTQFHKLASHGWHTDWHQQLLPNDTSPVLLLSLISERRAKFSTADFPRGETHFLYKAQCEFRWYFLGSQSLWIQVRISPEAVPGSHFYPGLLTLDMNRFYRKNHNAVQLCFPLCPFPHT